MPAITRFPGHQKFDDNIRLYFGSGASPSEAGDASIYFDGTNLLISGSLVYSGAMNFDSTIDQDLALTAAGDGFNQTVTINHATATVEGQDLAVTQLTTARSSGEVVGHKVTLTGVATDSGGTYLGMDFNASDAGGSGLFYGFKFDAGWDAIFDLSECATGEADIIFGDNLASAFQGREAANLYWTLASTNSNEVWSWNSGLTLGVRHDDSVPLRFGTPGTDLVMTPDGTDVVVTATGDLVFADSVDVYLGTGKDLRLYHDGTDSFINSILGTGKLRLGLPNTDGTSSFYLEQTGANPLLTVASDAAWALYVKDASATSFVIAQAANTLFKIDTTTSAKRIETHLPVSMMKGLDQARRMVFTDDFYGAAGATLPNAWSKDVQASATGDYDASVGKGIYVLALTAADEAQAGQILGPAMNLSDGPIFRARFAINNLSALTSVERLVVGVSSAHTNAEDSLDNVTTNAWFRVEGTSANLLYEKDDGTDVDDQDTTVDVTEDGVIDVEIDFTTLATTVFRVAGATVATVSMAGVAANTIVRPFFCIQRTDNTQTEGAPELRVDYVGIAESRD